MKIFRIFMIFTAACACEAATFSAYAHQGRYAVVYSGEVNGGVVRDRKIIRKRDCASARGKTQITSPEFAAVLACSAISGGGIVQADIDGEEFPLSVKLGGPHDSCRGCRSLFVEPSLETGGRNPSEEIACRNFSASGSAMIDKNGGAMAGRAEVKLQNSCDGFFQRPVPREFIAYVAWAHLGR